MKKESKKLYPLGSIVYLQDGTEKIVIIGRGVQIYDGEVDSDVFYDYAGCRYPLGINPDEGLFFNEDNIDKVVFEGYSDEEEERYNEVFYEWLDNNEVIRKEIE